MRTGWGGPQWGRGQWKSLCGQLAFSTRDPWAPEGGDRHAYLMRPCSASLPTPGLWKQLGLAADNDPICTAAPLWSRLGSWRGQQGWEEGWRRGCWGLLWPRPRPPAQHLQERAGVWSVQRSARFRGRRRPLSGPPPGSRNPSGDPRSSELLRAPSPEECVVDYGCGWCGSGPDSKAHRVHLGSVLSPRSSAWLLSPPGSNKNEHVLSHSCGPGLRLGTAFQ